MTAEIELAGLLTLEEISIEKTISELFDKGKIKHLSADQKSTADHYINENYEIISGQVQSYFAIRNQLQKYLGNQRSSIFDATS